MPVDTQKIFKLIEANWYSLNDETEQIATEYGTKKPKIIAVSKTRSIEEVEIAYDVGIRDFGENYAQEFERKAIAIPKANWHFIGHLQRGNVKKVVPYCFLLHTLDSAKLARRLANLSFQANSLIQIKMGTEISKSGLEGNIEVVKGLLEEATKLNLNVTGLMGIGSLAWGKDETVKRYRWLSDMKKQLKLADLSLGMSDDYKEAIIAGSTMIRIGTKIFGPRR